MSPLLQGGASETAELATELDQRLILYVVFDELPTSSLMNTDETIDEGRFPSFGELARTSTWFRRAVSTSPETFYSIPSLVTGALPVADAQPVVASYPNNLFRWLGASGYELFVYQNLTRLCPQELCREIVPRPPVWTRLNRLVADTGVLFAHLVAPEPWTRRLPAIDQTWAGFAQVRGVGRPDELGSSVPRVVESYLSAIQSAPGSRLYYLHLNLPHVPWKFLPSGAEYGPVGQPVRPPGLRGEVWGDDEWLTIQGYQQHLLQTAYADRVLGQLMARMRETGLWNHALVIVTADHGTAFWPSAERRWVEDDNVEDTLEVPLFVKLPDQVEGDIDDRAAQTLDVVATIADVLGAAVPWQHEGASLIQAADGAQRQRFYVQPRDGARVKRPVEVSSNRRQKTLERKQRHFGSGDLGSIYEIGLHSELLGRSLAESEIGSSSLTYRLLDAWALDNVAPESEFLPARVWAELEGSTYRHPAQIDGSEGWLAVALNGTIRAVTRPFVDPQGRSWFTAMLDGHALVAGRNRLEVLEIGSGEPPNLLRMSRGSAAEVRLLRSGTIITGISIGPSDGEGATVVPVEPTAVRGYMRLLADRIGGWAATSAPPVRAYDELFLFRGDRLLYRGSGERLSRRRTPVPYASFRVELARVGFADVDELRLFARVGSVASELSPLREAGARQSLQLARLHRDGEGRVRFETRQGNDLRLHRRSVVGNVGPIEVAGQQLRVEGWAAQRDSRLPVASLIVMVGDEALSGHYERVDLPTIAERQGVPEVQAYGFRLHIPLGRLSPAESARVRLFAVAEGGLAGELQANGRRLAPVVRRRLAEAREGAN